MNIQIFGLKKCPETRKAQRFFKERGIRFQLVDLAEKGLSKGELRSVAAKVPLDQLINRSSKRFVEKGLAHASLDNGKVESLLLEEPLLLSTPVVRERQTSDSRALSGGVERLGVTGLSKNRFPTQSSLLSYANASGAWGMSFH